MSKAKKANEWMPLRIEAYRNKTQGLTTIEHGAYLLLLIEYWKTQKPIPNRDRHISSITRLSLSEWVEIKEVILEFFEEKNGLLHNRRMDEELVKAESIVSRNRANGSKGGRPKKPIITQSVMNGLQNMPENITQKKDTRVLGVRQSEGGQKTQLIISNDDPEIDAAISKMEDGWNNDPALVNARAEARERVAKNKLRGVS